jgi:phosphomannomutase
VPLGRATSFIPIDTEALRGEDEVLMRQWASEQTLHAIVSTDGDADRPLVADATGTLLRGDLVGAITAKFLGAETVVSPVTSNSALEACGVFDRVVRTKVGSPYVIDGIAEAARSGARTIIGFEANGGVLLGTTIQRGGRELKALPTRDAMLPILCALGEVNTKGKPLKEIGLAFEFKAAASNCLKNVPTETSAAFVSRLKEDDGLQSEVLASVGGIAEHDTSDGLRMIAKNGEVIHFRPSGNAPELRVYVEAATQERATELLIWGLAFAEQHTH